MRISTIYLPKQAVDTGVPTFTFKTPLKGEECRDCCFYLSMGTKTILVDPIQDSVGMVWPCLHNFCSYALAFPLHLRAI
jgi:hypothetical protein